MTFYHTLLEQYQLMESLESTIKSNPHIPESIIRGYHKDALPDNNKNDRLLSHVLKMHNSGDITPESAHRFKPHLTALSNTNQLHQLKHLNTLDDHINATKGIMDKSVTKKERIDSNTPVILNTPDLLVRQHLNHESAIKGARLHPENPVFKTTREPGKAQWCVSVDDENGKTMFDHYTENGKNPVFTIFNKKTKRSTAIVPRPSDTYTDNEIRGETDDLVSPYKLLKNNPGIEQVKPIMDHINTYMPEVHDVIKKLPFNANKKQIVDAITSSNVNHRNAAFEHDIKPYIDEVLPNKNAALHLLKTKYPLESHHIDALVVHTDPEVRRTVAGREDLESHHINRLVEDDDPEVRRIVAQHDKLESHHIDKLVDDTDPKVLSSIAKHKKLESDHIDKLVAHDDPKVLSSIAEHKKLESDHIDRLVAHDDPKVRSVIAQHDKLEPEHVEKLVNDTDPDVLSAIIHYGKLESDHIDKLMRNDDPEVRRGLSHSKYLKPRHIDGLVKDTHPSVRINMAYYKDLEPEHIEKLLGDDNKAVQMSAATNRNITPTQIENIFKSNDRNKLLGLTENKTLTNDHIERLLRHDDPDIRANLAFSGNLYKEQLQHMADNDEDEEVQNEAKNSLYDEKYRKE